MGVVAPDREIEISAVRSAGAGGENVNKVSSAVHLRFDVTRSSLPAWLKARLLGLRDQRLTHEGVLVIKAQASRSQDRNKADALARLQALIDEASHTPRVRKATRPTLGSKLRRLESKGKRSALKAQRAKGGDTGI